MIKTDVYLKIGYTKDDIKDAICARLPIERCALSDICVLRSELSLKDKSKPEYKLSVGISLPPEREAGLLNMRKKVSAVPDCTLTLPTASVEGRPVVVGAGPCGLFAALILAEAGARPVVLERGEPVFQRRKKVELFSKLGILDTESNVQFGEGGAGTYSDGKLKVGSMDKYKMKVLREFVNAGANDDILHSVTAHLGTDKLSDIVAGLRNKIISLGGEFIYSARLVDIEVRDGRISSLKYEKAGESITLPAADVVLAIGHSARDTFEMLYKKGIPMSAKGFGIGVRIEHPREYINELVYGNGYDRRLETASYHLVTHLKNGRSVYSFCMCPGGTVVPAASESGGIVTNGMSEYLRDGENSNAALLVSVTPADFSSQHPLAGMELQRRIERCAYSIGGENYAAPAIRLEDFKSTTDKATVGSVKPTYPVGITPARPEDYLPSYITESLRASISDFDEWMGGYYYPDAVLTGPETRTTSPVRILRGENHMIPNYIGIYPAGEGAGYSGGIVSSATDGVRCAISLLQRYEKI